MERRVMEDNRHKESFKNRAQLEKAKVCGCFYCGNIFPVVKVKEWVDNKKTALCPKCGIDAVVPFFEEMDEDLKNFSLKLEMWYNKSFRRENE